MSSRSFARWQSAGDTLALHPSSASTSSDQQQQPMLRPRFISSHFTMHVLQAQSPSAHDRQVG